MATPKRPKTTAAASGKRKATRTQRHLPTSAKTPCIVGIGASAGGFEAMHSFFHAMPAQSGLAFVVIQHLDPTRESRVSDIVGKWTTMPVSEATQGERVEPNHVYMIPPNKYLAIHNSTFRLSTPKQPRGLRLPIDHFFDSLGRDQKERAVGIILSGTGSDGSLGLKSIELNGGIVLAQDPDSATFNGMPLSAISTGAVKSVLAVEKMPAVVLDYARHPYAAGTADQLVKETGNASSFNTILDLIRLHFRFNFSGYKHATLLRRIHRRMGLHHVTTLDDYAVLLRKQSVELDALFKDMFITVTDFFRDPAAWKILESEVIAPMVRDRANGEPIRVWVPACSTGEEAYSIAMLILDVLKTQKKHCPLLVFATDINEAALRIARLGIYPSGIATHVPSAFLPRFFTPNAENQQYQVSQELRTALVFGRQNLISDPPFSQLDLITCRNVLIYLEPEIQKKLIQLFDFALRPGGYLFLGSAETIGSLTNRLTPLSKKWRIFRQLDPTRAKPPDFPIMAPTHVTTLATLVPKAIGTPLSYVATLSQRLLLDKFAPAAVLVNSKYETLYFCGPTDRFMTQPRGTPTQNVLTLVRDGLRSHLLSALHEVEVSNKTVVVADAHIKLGSEYQLVKLSVIPAVEEQVLGQTYLVVFEDLPQPAIRFDERDEQTKVVRQLEEELRVTREDLFRAIERKDTSAEELKISNEEVISVNEELRSFNEELESSKEELQSLNEELSTVNQQLQSKVLELENANNDLKNLLSSSDIASLCLDRQLHIKWFTPGIQPLFKLIPTDIGRSISDFAEVLSGDGFISDVKAVLKKHDRVSKELQLPNGSWYLRRVLPYRNEHDAITGTTITFADISEIKHNTEALLASQQLTAQTLEQRVQERTEQLRALSVEITLAEDRERRALARDLHDDLGQVLTVAKIKIAALEKLEKVADLKQRVAEINGILDKAHTAVRSLTFQLSPPILHELGLIAALEWLGEEMHRLYGLAVTINDDGKPKPMTMPVSTILFRAVRELLINVAKHAEVVDARVLTKRLGNQILIQVEDAGIGFHPHHKPKSAKDIAAGFGLLSVRERLSYIGGEMRTESVPGDGTIITLLAPLTVETRVKEKLK